MRVPRCNKLLDSVLPDAAPEATSGLPQPPTVAKDSVAKDSVAKDSVAKDSVAKDGGIQAIDPKGSVASKA
jgi:hypothetical protein